MLHHEHVNEEPVIVSDADDGLSAALEERIIQFNEEATGIRDGRLLSISRRNSDRELEGGLSGWTWGGCAYIEYVWVRADRRGHGLGSRLLAAAEEEAQTRGCTQIVVFSHTFQAPEFYRRHGYVEYGRIDDYPRGHGEVHFAKQIPPR